MDFRVGNVVEYSYVAPSGHIFQRLGEVRLSASRPADQGYSDWSSFCHVCRQILLDRGYRENGSVTTKYGPPNRILSKFIVCVAQKLDVLKPSVGKQLPRVVIWVVAMVTLKVHHFAM